MNTSEIVWAAVLACTAQAVYFVAFVLFKTAVGRIGPIGGRRPLHAAGLLLRSPRWVAGVLVILAGFALFAGGLIALPVVAALPAYGMSLALLLVVGMSGFGERPTSREWLAVIIVVAAMVTAALSVLPAHGEPLADALHRPDGARAAQALPLWKAGLVFVPSLGLPLWMFFLRDRPVAGRHARPITGIAYGLGAGVLLGATEVFGQGMAMMLAGHRGAAVLSSPHPYLFVLAGVLGLGLLSLGLQRCRLTIIVTVVTVTAKTHLLLSATLLYGEPWPHAPALFLLRVAGVLLAVLALLAFPRHERRPAPRPARPPRRAAAPTPALAAPTPALAAPAPALAAPTPALPERPVGWTAPRPEGRYARTPTRFPDDPSAYPDSPLESPPPAGWPIVRPVQPPDSPVRFPAGG
ncbi:hypothetical protein [Actinomadura napierensis]|uniref:Uncharacterized protein n=1 Tax=Actinomadura napierensis TaxID=267854 RepID=A0ABP5M5H4_9ACTN